MDENNNTQKAISHWYDLKLGLVLKGICVGILSGLLVVAFRYALEKTGLLSEKIYAFLSGNIYYLPLWIAILTAIAYIIKLIIVREPMTKGSGIPQVEGVLLRQLDCNWWRVLAGKFIGGVLCIGAGLSLGREGPSIQIGALVGQGFSRVFKRPKVEEKFLITGGASAGLAAAFNAPLSGVIFALEEVHKNFSPLILLTAASAALTADALSKEFFGMKPVLNFSELPAIPIYNYWSLILLGIIAGLAGAAFNLLLVKTQDLYGLLKKVPLQFRLLIPLGAACVLGFLLPDVHGGGHHLIVSVANGSFLIKTLIIILIVKFAFTVLSFGSGVPGGIFLPMLAIGAVLGKLYATLLGGIANMDESFMNNFVILAMAAYFTASVRAPITGIVLITEMTGSFSHLLSLATVSITAYIVADILKSKPIYETLLNRILNDTGDSAFKGDEAVKVVLEVAVCMGSSIDGKAVRDVRWPQKCLLVGVRRGNQEIIPNGSTSIAAGDYLIVLADEDSAARIKRKLFKLANDVNFNTGESPGM